MLNLFFPNFINKYISNVLILTNIENSKIKHVFMYMFDNMFSSNSKFLVSNPQIRPL